MEQVALGGLEPELDHGQQLVRGLDALGHDRLPALAGELPERAEDGLGGVVGGPGLDQRQVDLDDVELELPEQAQAGVAGAHVVRGDPDAVAAQQVERRAQPGQVLHGLALGELEHDPRSVDVAPPGHREQLARLEGVRLERPRRQVDREVVGGIQVPRAGQDRVQAGHVQLDRVAGGLGGDEQGAGVREPGVCPRPDEALVAQDPAGLHRVDRLEHGGEQPVRRHARHRGGELVQRPPVVGDPVAGGVEGLDVRPPVTLAPRESRLRLVDELLAVVREAGQRRHADRERERGDPVRAGAAAERVGQDPPGDRDGLVRPAVREQHGELVAADPVAAVGPSELGSDDPGRGLQELVTRPVAPRRVDGLEVVDIHDQQRQGPVVAARLGHLDLQVLLERPVVEEASESVAQGIDPDPVVGLAQVVPLLVKARELAQDPAHDHGRQGEERHAHRQPQHVGGRELAAGRPHDGDRGRDPQDREREVPAHDGRAQSAGAGVTRFTHRPGPSTSMVSDRRIASAVVRLHRPCWPRYGCTPCGRRRRRTGPHPLADRDARARYG